MLAEKLKILFNKVFFSLEQRLNGAIDLFETSLKFAAPYYCFTLVHNINAQSNRNNIIDAV